MSNDREAGNREAPERPWYIYALADPRTGAIRYVGKTTGIKGRLAQHISEAMGSWTPAATPPQPEGAP